MPAPLEYDFRVVGLRTVKNAIRNVERDVIASTRRIMRAGGMSPGAVRSGGYTPRRSNEANVQRRAEEQAARARVQAEQKAAKVRLTTEQRAEKARIAAVHKAAKEEERARAKLDRGLRRDRASREISRRKEIERETKARAMAARREESRQLVHARARASTRAAMFGTAGRSAISTVSGIGRYAMMSAGLLGGFATGGAIRNAQRVETGVTQLANQAFRQGSPESRDEIAAKVRTTARQVGVESGFGAEGVVQALRQFTAISGNLEGGMKLSKVMADIADATGADIGDVGRTGGQIMQAMMARNVPQEDAVRQVEEIFRSMAAQGKLGSIEFKDLATQMGSLISSTSRFEGEIDKTVSTMGAFAQLAIAGGASSPEEAMTAIKRFSDDLVQNAARWEKMLTPEQKKKGFSYFTDESKSKIRDPAKVMMDILRVTGGDLTKTKKLFGIRAMKGVEPMLNIFSEVVRQGGGGEAGVTAALAKLAEFRNARMSSSELRGSARAARATSEKQFAIAMEQFNQAVGTELMPVVTRLVPKLAALIPHLATAAKWLGRFIDELAKNPLSTIGKVIAAKVALDIAGAGIGNVIKSMITRMMLSAETGSLAAGGATGAVTGGGAAGTTRVISRGPTMMGLNRGAAGVIAGALTAALTGITLGVVVKEAIEVSMIKGWHDTEEKSNDLMKRAQQAMLNGTTADIARVTSEIQAERDKLAKRQELAKTARLAATGGFGSESQNWGDTVAKVGYALANPLGAVFGATTPMEDVERQQFDVPIKSLDTTLKKLGEAEVNTNAFLASMNAASTGNEEFLTSINSLAANFQKLGEAADKAASSVGRPNTGDTPTKPES